MVWQRILGFAVAVVMTAVVVLTVFTIRGFADDAERLRVSLDRIEPGLDQDFAVIEIYDRERDEIIMVDVPLGGCVFYMENAE